MEKTENYLKLLLTIFFSHKKLILYTSLVFAGLSILVALFYPPVYKISGDLIVKSKKIKSPPESVGPLFNSRNILPPSGEDLQLESKIVSSNALIKISLKALDKKGDRIAREDGAVVSFCKKFIVQPMRKVLVFIGILDGQKPGSRIEKLSKDISDSLYTTIVPGSNMIQIELFNDDPNIGTNILNSIFDNYLTYRLAIFSDPSVEHLFSQQIAKFKNTLEDLNKKKIEILNQYQITDVEKQMAIELDIISTTKKSIFKQEDELFNKKREVRYLKQMISEYSKDDLGSIKPFPYGFKDENIKNYNQQLAKLVFDYIGALRTYNKNVPKIVLMENQIQDLKSMLVSLIQQNIKGKQDEIESLTLSIANERQRLDKLNHRSKEIYEGNIELVSLDNSIRINQENYETFLKKYEENRIEETSEATQKSNVQILNRASVPDGPFFPKKKLVIPIGILAGFLLGLSLAFVVEFFDHKFRTPLQVKQYLQLPVIGSIPIQRA